MAANDFEDGFRHILLVCRGNVCRSPTAAVILRHRLGGSVQIESAGIAAHEGLPIDALAAEVLADHGLDAAPHRSQRVTPELLRDADIVMVMERRHEVTLRAEVPEATGKIFLLDKWVAGRDIPDPYRRSRGTFERVYQMIEQGVAGWLPHLR